MNEKIQSKDQVKQGYTIPSRKNEYARIAKLLPKAIKRLGELLDHPNCNVRLGAANKVLDKCLPDLRAMEVKGEDGGPVVIKIISEANANYRIADSELPQAASDI